MYQCIKKKRTIFWIALNFPMAGLGVNKKGGGKKRVKILFERTDQGRERSGQDSGDRKITEQI
jgi:hypothetical protein